ncbi:hypothetical protein GCM10009808_12960 [Microbacterium sediminicola]|uniref:Glycosyltransferase 2-like domain-containing protein n=1 Tax=Microbacterium sediminicola TaxID=415210 RepID=A0ABP4U1C8_9MICO
MSQAVATFIVPGRDVAPYVHEALDSLQAQTRADWRAILIDDGSVDDTGKIFERAARADDRLRVIHHARAVGLGAARNVGLDLVDTPYVGFLDADDVLAPHALTRFVETLERTGSDLAIAAYSRLRPTADGSYAASEVQPWVTAATSPARERTTLAEHPAATASIVAWAKLVRTPFWGLRRFPEGRLYEDQEVAQDLLLHARAFDTIPEPLVLWRVRADGSSITQREGELAVLQDCLAAMRGGLAVLRDEPAALRARTELILAMDIPRLEGIAETHTDPRYRAEVERFRAEIRSLLPARLAP